MTNARLAAIVAKEPEPLLQPTMPAFVYDGDFHCRYVLPRSEPCWNAEHFALAFSFFRDAPGYGDPRITGRFEGRVVSSVDRIYSDVHRIDMQFRVGMYLWVALVFPRLEIGNTNPLHGMFVNCGAISVLQSTRGARLL